MICATRSDPAFHTAKHRFTKSGRKARDGAFHTAPYTVTYGSGFCDLVTHCFRGVRIQGREEHTNPIQLRSQRIKTAAAYVSVVSGTGIFVVDHSGNGSAAGKTVQYASQKFRPVFLTSGRREVVLSRSTAVQEILKRICIHRKSRRDPIEGHADGWAMRLTEDG